MRWSGQGEFEVVGEAADGDSAVREALALKPDVIIMDVIMPLKDGIEACREIVDILPGTRVLMFTASPEEDAVVESFAAGATGYLEKYSGKGTPASDGPGRCPGGIPHTERGREARLLRYPVRSVPRQ